MLTTPAAEATFPGRNGRLAFGDNVGKAATAPDIYTVRADGTRRRQLTDDDLFDACAAYSPDGRWIAWCKGTVTPERHLEIWVMRANGHHQRPVTHLDGYATFPDFSPDGRHLVFTLVSEDGATDLWTVGVNGKNLKRLTNTRASLRTTPPGRPMVDIAFLRGAPSTLTTRRSGSGISGTAKSTSSRSMISPRTSCPDLVTGWSSHRLLGPNR